MDARGHGKSDKPHDPEAYTMKNRAGDVIAVLNELGIDSTHFFGYSYGGRVTFELAIHFPERVKSLIAAGIGARGQNPDFLGDRIRILEAGPEALVAAFEQTGSLTPDMKTRLLVNDCEALVSILRTPWPYRENDLPVMNRPFLLLAGEFDPGFSAIEKASKRLPDSTFIFLPGLDHMQTASRINVVLPHVKEFLARVS